MDTSKTTLKLLGVMSQEYETCCQRGDKENADGLYHSILNIIKNELREFASEPHFIIYLMNEAECGHDIRSVPARYLLNYYHQEGLLKWNPKK